MITVIQSLFINDHDGLAEFNFNHSLFDDQGL